jgi:hypothetical protein
MEAMRLADSEGGVAVIFPDTKCQAIGQLSKVFNGLSDKRNQANMLARILITRV